MTQNSGDRRRGAAVLRAIIEVAFIVFLFYANLLMGEFTAANGQGKTLSYALHDVITGTNFAIGIGAAVVGYVVFEALRKRL
ncbi:MAG: hypothetical protein WCC26_06795 [Terracidiphilus sp.]